MRAWVAEDIDGDVYYIGEFEDLITAASHALIMIAQYSYDIDTHIELAVIRPAESDETSAVRRSQFYIVGQEPKI
jgi:hypothetical protein